MMMQYAEGLTDRQIADAVRMRIDWKYALLRRVARGDILGATRKNEKGGLSHSTHLDLKGMGTRAC